MNREERRSVYNLWSNMIKESEQLKIEAKTAEITGDTAFNKLKDTDRELAFETGDESGWRFSDDLNEKAKNICEEANKLYEQLTKHSYNLSEFESCAQIGHTIKKTVEVTFLNGEQLIGYILPWEGDYAGPPYTFTNEKGSIYIDNGWELYNVKLIKVDDTW